MEPSTLLMIADIVLFLHVLFVIFVLMGLILIYIGKAFSWQWVRNPWFRIIHIIAIFSVVVMSWVGMICPLTSLEMALRKEAGTSYYSGSFIVYWLNEILYYSAPKWVFVTAYTVIGAVIVASWYFVRPRGFKNTSSSND